MLQLFQAGAIAALMRCIAILLATLLIFSYAHNRIENLQVPADDPAVLSLIPLLQLIYLLTAVGVAATRHRLVDLTAARIRRASRLMNHSDPDRAANTLMISLWFKDWKTDVPASADAFAFAPPADANKVPLEALVNFDEVPQGVVTGAKK
jgi:hypothetical protein